MTKTKRSSQHRAIALFVIILLVFSVMLTLSSCGQEKLSRGAEMSDAGFAAEILKKDSNLLIQFVAASRGNDMTAEGFVDTPNNTVANHEAASRILTSAINAVKFNSEDEKTAILSYAEDLSANDVYDVVDLLGSDYDLNQNASWIDTLLIWIGKALGWITSLVGNSYVVAILIFAVLVEILMLPVAIKQQKNSIGMAKLRPQIARIEKKYAGRTDQATLRKKQEEIMELQQREGFSPFSGCLPLLVQLIIVGFILYPIIQNPLRFVLDTSSGFSNALVAFATAPQAAGGLGLTMTSNGNVIELLTKLASDSVDINGIVNFALINNGDAVLSQFNSLQIPDFTLFGLEIGRVPGIIDILVIVPLLNVAVQWVTMKLTRKWTGTGMPQGGDAQSQASMKIMDLMMPLMTLFIMFQVPALIGIYWFFRSLISLLKSYIMKIVMPVPKYTDEELREIEKAQKAAEKAQKEALKEQPKFRSLHYIDEDDYDELPTMKTKDGDGKSKQNGAINNIPDIKD